MKFFDQKSCVGVEADLEIKSGNYSAIMLRYSGTAAGGVTFANTHPGVIRVDQAGEGFVNANFSLLHALSDFLYGYPEQTSAIGAAFAFTALIPLSYPVAGAPAGWNSRNFKANEGLIHVPSIAAAVATPCTVEAYGLSSDNPEIYAMQIFQESLTLGGLQEKEYAGNLEAFFIGAAATTEPTKIEVIKDGRLKFAMTSAAAIALTDSIARKEAASLAHKFVDLNPNRSPNGIYSANVLLHFVGGAGLISWLRLGNMTRSDRRSVSLSIIADTFERMRRAKSDANQTPPRIAPLPIVLGQTTGRR